MNDRGGAPAAAACPGPSPASAPLSPPMPTSSFSASTSLSASVSRSTGAAPFRLAPDGGGAATSSAPAGAARLALWCWFRGGRLGEGTGIAARDGGEIMQPDGTGCAAGAAAARFSIASV